MFGEVSGTPVWTRVHGSHMVFHNRYSQGILLHPLLSHWVVSNMPGIDRHQVKAPSFPAFLFPFLLPWPSGRGASSCEVLPTRVIPAGVGSHGEPGLHLAAKRTAWVLFPTGQNQTAQWTQMGFQREMVQLNFRSKLKLCVCSEQTPWLP